MTIERDRDIYIQCFFHHHKCNFQQLEYSRIKIKPRHCNKNSVAYGINVGILFIIFNGGVVVNCIWKLMPFYIPICLLFYFFFFLKIKNWNELNEWGKKETYDLKQVKVKFAKNRMYLRFIIRIGHERKTKWKMVNVKIYTSFQHSQLYGTQLLFLTITYDDRIHSFESCKFFFSAKTSIFFYIIQYHRFDFFLSTVSMATHYYIICITNGKICWAKKKKQQQQNVCIVLVKTLDHNVFNPWQWFCTHVY